MKTTICGTDLHILKGDVATCSPGRILGHEGVGITDSVGAGVTAFRVGDCVLISCIPSSGKCEYCRRGMYSHFSTNGKAAETVNALTGRRGVDTAIEAVGVPATFQLCENLIAPRGVIANIGVHGQKVELYLERLWSQNITITTRLVDTVTTPMLLKTVLSKKIDPARLITHRFKLDQILDAYDTFGRAAETQALKVIISA
jgi:alcohol dehydrogenase